MISWVVVLDSKGCEFSTGNLEQIAVAPTELSASPSTCEKSFQLLSARPREDFLRLWIRGPVGRWAVIARDSSDLSGIRKLSHGRDGL